MTIDKQLQALVELYATYDPQNKVYQGNPDPRSLLKLDGQFNQLINRFLLSSGPEKENIEPNYRKLVIYFHPDKKSNYSPAVVWLEQQLSKGVNDGTCFKTLDFCHLKLVDPNRFKTLKFTDIILDGVELQKWLEKLKEDASTYTSRHFYDSLLGLLDQSGSYYDELGQLNTGGIEALLGSIPIALVTGFGLGFVGQHLFAAYTVYLVLLKGGQFLERTDYIELRTIGKSMQDASHFSSAGTTIILARILELLFWSSRQCYTITLQVGTALLTPLINLVHSITPSMPMASELYLESQDLTKGIPFTSEELKKIALPLEAYLNTNGQQYFLGYRQGGLKRKAIETFLDSLKYLDDTEQPLYKKLVVATVELAKVKNCPEVYVKGSQAELAVNRAEYLLELFKNQACTDLVQYSKPVMSL